MKQLKEKLAGQVDAALNEQARAAESWASIVRAIFALSCVAMAVWMWNHFSTSKNIYLMLAFLWVLQTIVARAMTRTSLDLGITTTTLLDVTIVNIGLLAFVQQGLFPKYGAGVFFFYFPVLAVAANRYRVTLVVKATLYAAIFYGALSLYAGSPPWFRLMILLALAVVCVMGARKPKEIALKVAGDAVQEAYDQGARVSETEMRAKAHEMLFPPHIIDLPAAWISSKHGAGIETGGDYFQVFETSRGPLIALGDFGGASSGALTDIARLDQQFSKAVSAEQSLAKILERVNQYVYDKGQGRRPLTCLLAEWEGDIMRYVNAGHLPAIQIGKAQRTQLTATCEAVGLRPNVEFNEVSVNFPARDLLVAFTNGVYAKLTDDPGQGVAEIESFIDKFTGAEVTTLCHRLFDCAQPGYEPNKDDSTMVVIRRQP